MKKWVVDTQNSFDDIHIFDTEEDACDYFNETIGNEAHGKDHWCEMYDEFVAELTIEEIKSMFLDHEEYKDNIVYHTIDILVS